MKCDLHIHSNHSFDSFMDPWKIAWAANVRNLSVISVTDHDTMDVYAEAFSDDNRREILDRYGLYIVKGMEVSTDVGDVIGIFLDREIQSTTFDDVVTEIQEQDGLVILPHPYHREVNPENLVEDVDLVEARNGRCHDYQNEQAISLAKRFGKPVLGGSDAHIYWEIGTIVTELPDRNYEIGDEFSMRSHLLTSDRDTLGSPLPYPMTHGVSFATSRIKSALQAVMA